DISVACVAINEITDKLSLDEKWPFRKLGDISSLSRGASPRPIEKFITDREDGVPWIKIGDVAPGDKFIRKTAEKITPEGASKSRRVYAGDFIISNSMSVGRPYIVDIDGCVHDGWLIVSGVSKDVNKDYLFCILSGENAQSQFQNRALGGVVKNLNIDRAKSVSIPVPPLSVQQQIVARIETQHQIIAAAKTLIAAAPARKDAILRQYL
ncbi:MAG: restriction endonuclease subunit S, partial [Zoogloeaceae bacterium]|nr:restriction endonuclease subunit S [Zoogloeaceae bacterium]